MLTNPTILHEYISTLSPALQAVAKSHLSHIFLTNPWLSKFYAGYFQLCARNSNLTNVLASRSGNFSDLNLNLKGSNPMPLNKNIRLCDHIKVNGLRCGSPALHGEVFCYFHQRMIRGVATPPKSRLHPIALLENEESIQASLMEVINALVRNTIDLRRAQLILRALHIAVKNSPRARFDLFQHEMVQEVPEYPAAPAPPKAAAPAMSHAEAAQAAAEEESQRITAALENLPALVASADPARPKPPASVKAATQSRQTPRPRPASNGHVGRDYLESMRTRASER